YLELVPILGEQLELEAIRNPLDVPWLGLRLEAADDETADLFLEVDVAVRIANDGHVGCDAFDRLGDDVEMLGGLQGHGDACERAEFARPLAGAIDDVFATDGAALVACRPAEPRYATVMDVDAGNLRAFDDARATVARTLRERLREIGRIGLAVAGNRDPSGKVVGAQQRQLRADLIAREPFEFDTEASRARHLPAHQLHALGRLRDVHAAALLPSGREPRFLLERRIELDAVAAHARRIARRAHLADETGRMPRRAAG